MGVSVTFGLMANLEEKNLKRGSNQSVVQRRGHRVILAVRTRFKPNLSSCR
jgi:hypothetical protein